MQRCFAPRHAGHGGGKRKQETRLAAGSFNALIPFGNLVAWVLPKSSNKTLNIIKFIGMDFLSYRQRYRQKTVLENGPGEGASYPKSPLKTW
jgi:hypothetical protein